MMSGSELHPKNYKRISIINWLLLFPLLVLFAWPYYYLAEFASFPPYIAYPGAMFFAVPFMITILHGHVTMALGEAHRHHYYQWLYSNPLSYGFLFHPVMMRTRFRLILLAISGGLLLAGYLQRMFS